VIRYRWRIAGTKDDWSRAMKRREALKAVRRRLDKGPKFRLRRRDRDWSHWFKRRRYFMFVLGVRLKAGKPANYQAQLNDGKFQIGILKYREVVAKTDGEKAVALALTELGTPYRFGEANGPEDPGTDGFDCSGLTQWAWAGANGTVLPHAARLQEDAPNVWNFKERSWLKSGDLIFFWFPNSRQIPYPVPSHVGLFSGVAGRVVDTRSQSSPVAIRDIEWPNVVGFGRPQ
jgi:hypothetical protein